MPNWKVGAARDLPISKKDAWEGAAAKARVFKAAGFDGEKPNPAKARRAFLAYDAAEPKLKGSYKLPFADMVGGRLTAIPGGLRNAASRLPQTDISANVEKRARAVLDSYFKRMPERSRSTANADRHKRASGKAGATLPTRVGGKGKFRDLIGRSLKRAVTLDASATAIDKQSRTVTMALTSDEPVFHGFAYVILDHGADSINLERLQNSAPLLENHDPDRRLGRLRNPRTDGRILRVDARFSNRPYANEIFNEVAEDLENGDTPTVSAVFTIEEAVEAGVRDGFPVVRATKWTPSEGSIVSLPADLSVGIGRSRTEDSSMTDEERKRRAKAKEDADEEEDEKDAGDDEAEEDDEEDKERAADYDKDEDEKPRRRKGRKERSYEMSVGEKTISRAREFVEFAGIFGAEFKELAREYAVTGKSFDELRGAIQERVKARASKPPLGAPIVDLSDAEKREYSIARAIRVDAQMRDSSMGGDTKCLELEVSQEIEKKLNAPSYRTRGGIFVPTGMPLRGAALKRAGLDTQTITKGKELVFTEFGTFIELLRHKARVIQMGATVMPGLQGNVAFPRQTGAGQTFWVGDNPGVDVADADLTLDQVLLSPKTLQSSTSFSRQLLNQGVVNVDNIVQNDLVRINALEVDRAALHGSGSARQPTGIYSLSGVNVVVFGGPITYAKVVEMETDIYAADADIGEMGYLTTPEVRGTAKNTPKLANTIALPIWEEDEMNGYRALATNQMSKTLGAGAEHSMVFGVWPVLMIGEWGAMEVITDPYRLKKQGMIEVTTFLMIDLAARHGQAFSKATGLTKS